MLQDSPESSALFCPYLTGQTLSPTGARYSHDATPIARIAWAENMPTQSIEAATANGGPTQAHLQTTSMRGYELPIYAFKRPAELAGSGRRRPVIIAGAGLTGLTLALDLGLRGIPVVVLDQDNSVGALGLSSRGVVYVHRTLEIFDRLGVAEQIIARGAGWTIGRVFKGEHEVYSFQSQSRGGRLPPNANLQQFFVEEALVDRVNEVSGIDIRWSSEITSVEASDSGVRLHVETPEGGYDIEGDWLAACDGGSSIIREQLGASSHTHLFDDIWCIADIRPTGGNPCERRLWMNAAFNAGGVVLNHNMAEGVCRFNFQISHYEDPEKAGTIEALRERLAKALGPDVDYEFVWTGVWRYKRRLMDNFVHDRVIYVGDSAHQVPPFGARGGNSGIADADNLGWKLAAVLRGEADPSLLQSYHDERHAAAVENAEVTSRSARFLAPDTPGRRLFRDAVLDLAHDLPAIRSMVNTGRLAIAQSYPTSPLNQRGSTGEKAGVAEGEPPVDGELHRADGSVGNLLDLVRNGFAIVWFAPPGAEIPRRMADIWNEVVAPVRRAILTREPCDADIESVVDRSGLLFAAYAGEEGATYVLRPDGYVLFRATGLVVPPAPHFLTNVGQHQEATAA
jgi:3-(3-hydroxy-phenyl)propionate hydroxylase